MNPLGFRICALLALAGVLTLCGTAYHHHVYQLGYDAAVSTRAAQDATHLAADTAKASVKTAALQSEADQKAIDRQQEKTRYEQTIADLHAAARRGDSGMRAPGACIPANSTSESTIPASGPIAETGYVLLPETASSVLDAAADLRQSVLDRNALIDKYELCRAVANGQ